MKCDQPYEYLGEEVQGGSTSDERMLRDCRGVSREIGNRDERVSSRESVCV